MRKLLLIAGMTALSVGAVAATAVASFDPHFEVYSKTINHRNVNGGTAFNEKLVDPARPVDKVGFDRGFCKPVSDRSAHCRVMLYLGGEIGGRGTIRASGVVGANDPRLNVNGGSGDFEGVAGKVLLADLVGGKYGPLHFDLVR